MNHFKATFLKFTVPLANSERIALEEYVSLVFKWNKKFNLTSRKAEIPDYLQLIHRALVLSRLFPQSSEASVADIGTGSGLPGIPVAITHPHWQLTLIDSHVHKIRFLEEVKRRLHLANVTIIHDRFPTKKLLLPAFTVGIMQAVGNYAELLPSLFELLRPDGILVIPTWNVTLWQLISELFSTAIIEQRVLPAPFSTSVITIKKIMHSGMNTY